MEVVLTRQVKLPAKAINPKVNKAEGLANTDKATKAARNASIEKRFRELMQVLRPITEILQIKLDDQGLNKTFL